MRDDQGGETNQTQWNPGSEVYQTKVRDGSNAPTVDQVFKAITKSQTFLRIAKNFERQNKSSQGQFTFAVLLNDPSNDSITELAREKISIVMTASNRATKELTEGEVKDIESEVALSLYHSVSNPKGVGRQILVAYVEKTTRLWNTQNQK